ncbi:MAG: hypothetical protein KKH67_05600, partial [candidate division Zixibacteria bacterium]|nr:hypothetical protein [candidate division Zixibacteria bacterium]MBU1470100.1 hypothetical protein [candidate division Zixibacteria bacterium]
MRSFNRSEPTGHNYLGITLSVLVLLMACQQTATAAQPIDRQNIVMLGDVSLTQVGEQKHMGQFGEGKMSRQLDLSQVVVQPYVGEELLPREQIALEISGQSTELLDRLMAMEFDPNCTDCEGKIEELLTSRTALSQKDLEDAAFQDVELENTLTYARSLGLLSPEWVESVTYIDGLTALIASYGQDRNGRQTFAVRFSFAELSKSLVMQFESTRLILSDQYGGCTIDLQTGIATVDGITGTKENCSYWECVANCFGGIGGLPGIICGALLGVCVAAPNPVTCGAAAVCFGAVGAYCLIDCNDPCTHCVCPDDPITLKGRVLTEGGSPWGGVEICVFDCAGTPLGAGYCVITGDDGRFSLAFEAPSFNIVIGFWRGCDPVYVTDCLPPTPGVWDFGDQVFPPCDANLLLNLFEAGVYCYVLPCGSDEPVAACQTDGSGTCVVSVAPGSYWFVFLRDCDCWQYYTECLDIPAGNWQIDIGPLPSCQTEICLEGRVLHSNGSAWSNLDVIIADCNYSPITSTTTDGSGSYSICFSAQDFAFVFDRGCCSGELLGTECISAIPCNYTVGDFTLDDCITDIDAPSGFSCTPGCGAISMSWNSVSGAEGYCIYRDNSQLTCISGTSYTDNSPGTSQRCYKVTAVLGNCESGYSNQSCCTAGQELPAPGNFSCTPGCGTISMSWNSVPGADEYCVYKDGVQQTCVATTNWTDNNPGTSQRCYKVTARNEMCGESGYSNESCCTASGDLPAPGNFSCTPGCGTISMSWNSVP